MRQARICGITELIPVPIFFESERINGAFRSLPRFDMAKKRFDVLHRHILRVFKRDCGREVHRIDENGWIGFNPRVGNPFVLVASCEDC